MLFSLKWSIRNKLILATGITALGLFTIFLADRHGIRPTLWLFNNPYKFPGYVFYLASNIDLFESCSFLSPVENKTLLRYPLVVLMILGSQFGVFLLITPVVWSWSWHKQKLEPVDWVIPFAFCWLLVFTFLTPENKHGCIDKIWHRPFVWAYYLIVGWTLAKGVALFHSTRIVTFSLVSAAVILLAWQFIVQEPIQQCNTKMPALSKTYIDQGLLDCCQFIQQNSAADAIVQGQEPQMDSLISALSERRAYCGQALEYFDQFRFTNIPQYQVCLQRTELVKQLLAATNCAELQQLFKQTGIDWIILAPNEVTNWPLEYLAHPEVRSHGYQLYRADRLECLPDNK